MEAYQERQTFKIWEMQLLGPVHEIETAQQMQAKLENDLKSHK